jgi:glycosyltransferase involved in cell wall biosynthesis
MTAMAVTNAAWRRSLSDGGVSFVDDESAEVLIHHDYSVRFGEATLPAAGRRVAVRPWDFGPYPSRWAQVVDEQYDELWVFTDWGRECAIAGGVVPARVRVTPLGVDTSALTPEGPVHEVTERAKTTFLFVGAAIYRKGIDIVLRAFLDAFDERDDVQLVVKDHTGDVFYRGISQREEILEAAARTGSPTICYIDDYMPESELAALYRGADALVLPSRAEGWALPPLEAMACGTPAIVPSFGAFLAYGSDVATVLVPTKRIRLPAGKYFTTNTLGFEEHVERVDFCETIPAALGSALRDFATAPEATQRQKARAARDTAERFSWAHSAAVIAKAISELTARVPSGDEG